MFGSFTEPFSWHSCSYLAPLKLRLWSSSASEVTTVWRYRNSIIIIIIIITWKLGGMFSDYVCVWNILEKI